MESFLCVCDCVCVCVCVCTCVHAFMHVCVHVCVCVCVQAADDLDHYSGLAGSTMACGTMALVVRAMIMLVGVFVFRNFNKGLKEKGRPVSSLSVHSLSLLFPPLFFSSPSLSHSLSPVSPPPHTHTPFLSHLLVTPSCLFFPFLFFSW